MAGGSTDSRKEAGSRPAAPALPLYTTLDRVLVAVRQSQRIENERNAMLAEPVVEGRDQEWRERFNRLCAMARRAYEAQDRAIADHFTTILRVAR